MDGKRVMILNKHMMYRFIMKKKKQMNLDLYLESFFWWEKKNRGLAAAAAAAGRLW